ncbi:MAG: glycine--tRNA ligase subunit beta [Burkholderiales bacterium]|nr:glycine--tRNA ligase subunit beta [Burkholderiales bacterium]
MSLVGNSLVIEFLSEELPPINLLENIGTPFTESIKSQLQGYFTDSSKVTPFITPRRFGCVINNINHEQKDQEVTRKGPAVATGLKDGNPTPALLGFAKSCGTEWQNLIQNDDGYFYFTSTVKGKSLESVIENTINTALKKVHIAKSMRWGDTDYQFVRPLHNLIVMLNDKVIPCNTLGLNSQGSTIGHRFMSHGEVKISNAQSYLDEIHNLGKVVVEFNARKEIISKTLDNKAAELGLKISHMDGLLEEVVALVEWPEILVGSFDSKYLKVPQECLILSMAKNQKYFALVDNNNKLSNKFLFVSNLISKDPEVIINGNQKVLSARLADAEFFYNFDKRTKLSDFVPRLANVVYHNKLGNQLERIERLQKIAATIAPLLNVDSEVAKKAAYLLKADLVTEMVGEFPELQGIMGNYYALASGETKEVANAIEKHYYPRFSGDELPDSALATVVSLADKLETLTGIWGIGLIPTGDKDPYALRRSALGIVRILLENHLNLKTLLENAFNSFDGKNLSANTVSELEQFIVQRLANYLSATLGYSNKVVSAVLANHSLEISQAESICKEFSAWANDTDNNGLFEANKRIENILKKNEAEVDINITINPELFISYETTLFNLAASINNDSSLDLYLQQLSKLSVPLTEFFANVMVMDDDVIIRKNRLKLLSDLYAKFNIYGKLSELA